MCCKCCESTYNIGCFGPCGIQFVTGAQTPIGLAGDWVLSIKFGRRITRYVNSMVEGQEINFMVGCLDAEYQYSAWIEKPDGSSAIFTINNTGYDCFSFTTKVGGKEGIEVGATQVQ